MRIFLSLLFACTAKSPDTALSDTSGADTSGADTSVADTADTGSPPVFETEALWSSADDWEPSITAAGEEVYQTTTRVGRDYARVVVRRSSDGGATWGDDVVISPEATDAYDPQIALAADVGCVLATWLDGDWMTAIVRSCDGGATWTDPVSIAPATGWTDHGWLLVSPDGQDVAVAYGGQLVGDASDEDASDHGYVVSSHDGGATFEAPVDVSGEADAAHYWFTSFGARAADGTLYVTAELYGADYTGPTDLVLWRSQDKGATWDQALVATSEEAPGCAWSPGCEYGYFASQMAVAVDVDGTVLVAWHASDVPDAPQSLFTATTTPDTWPAFTAPQTLSTGGDNAFPMATSGPTAGDFRLLYMANADGGKSPWNTWLQTSADGGATWLDEPVRLSNRGDGATYKSAEGYAFPYGDYNGIAVDGAGVTHAIWGEGPSWNGPGGTWYTRGL